MLLILLTILKKIKLLEYAVKVYVILIVIWVLTLLYPPLRDNAAYPIFDSFIRGTLDIIVSILSIAEEGVI